MIEQRLISEYLDVAPERWLDMDNQEFIFICEIWWHARKMENKYDCYLMAVEPQAKCSIIFIFVYFVSPNNLCALYVLNSSYKFDYQVYVVFD